MKEKLIHNDQGGVQASPPQRGDVRPKIQIDLPEIDMPQINLPEIKIALPKLEPEPRQTQKMQREGRGGVAQCRVLGGSKK